MRSIEVSFSELKEWLEDHKGVVFADGEYIRDVHWQMAYPEQIVFVMVDKNISNR